MMNLRTDEQTITDLGILGRNDGSSLFDIYNQTTTRGGEALLRDFFLNPLADQTAINRRSDIIRYFAERRTAFPFEAALLDAAEKYVIQRTDPANIHLTRKDNLTEKEIRQGVVAVIQTVQQLHHFMMEGNIRGVAAYQEDWLAITALLHSAMMKPALAESPKGRISFSAIAAYDALFRWQGADTIRKLLRYVYALDVFMGVARLAAGRQFTFPVALSKGGGILQLEGVYHPELQDAVGNTVMMDPARHVIFLTGANMAGKSTFLRSISSAVYTAHVGFPVAAKSMQFSVLDGLYTTINLPDNLGIGASHFYNEVLRVKKVAAELHEGKALFVVFDELFRGTNVMDAREATIAVTTAFAKKMTSLFVVSSHIVEAGEALRQQPGVVFRYLPTRMNGSVPEYTYRLEEGITDDRHGMIIIRNEGVLQLLEDGQHKGSITHNE